MRARAGLGPLIAAAIACGHGGRPEGGSPPAGETVGARGAAERWRPAVGASWQWQLSGALDASFDVAIYDVDLFETTAEQIAALHADGRKVICYLDAAYEPDRPDSAALAPYRGEPMDGWPGQAWLDVRAPAVRDVLAARIALAARKGCDAIEPDDVDAIDNDPGFPLTMADQLGFVRFLIDAGHRAGLAVALKNDVDQAAELADEADLAIVEECLAYDECDALAPFLAAGKPVLHVEYAEGDLAARGAAVCPRAPRGFSTLIKRRDLDAARFACP